MHMEIDHPGRQLLRQVPHHVSAIRPGRPRLAGDQTCRDGTRGRDKRPTRNVMGHRHHVLERRRQRSVVSCLEARAARGLGKVGRRSTESVAIASSRALGPEATNKTAVSFRSSQKESSNSFLGGHESFLLNGESALTRQRGWRESDLSKIDEDRPRRRASLCISGHRSRTVHYDKRRKSRRERRPDGTWVNVPAVTRPVANAEINRGLNSPKASMAWRASRAC